MKSDGVGVAIQDVEEMVAQERGHRLTLGGEREGGNIRLADSFSINKSFPFTLT